MLSSRVVADAQEYLAGQGLDGWLVHDYRHSNPVFSHLLGSLGMITRPCFLFIPAEGDAHILVHQVDAGRLEGSGLASSVYRDRASMVELLAGLAPKSAQLAMEYSPLGAIPRASRVDAGTVELVRSLGVEVVSSADLLQYATQRWSQAHLQSHIRAADKLGRIVLDAFNYAGHRLREGLTEYDIAQFILARFQGEGLHTADGPIVAINDHASDPHYAPTPEGSYIIRDGDWLLIDLWAKEQAEDSVYADITWVAFVGQEVPRRHHEVFKVVVGARDAALDFLAQCFQANKQPQGWEADAVARKHISQAGYGDYFTHRLGHSLGYEVHGEAVNLDGFETHDTRTILPGIGFTIEPGVYLPEFGVRSEIDVFMYESGPTPTTAVQREVVLITPR